MEKEIQKINEAIATLKLWLDADDCKDIETKLLDQYKQHKIAVFSKTIDKLIKEVK